MDRFGREVKITLNLYLLAVVVWAACSISWCLAALLPR